MFGQQSSSLFGGSTSTGFGFGAKPAGTTGFGGFGAASTIVGTTQKFEPVIGTDQVMKNGVNQTTNTKLMVITAMKVYENKTLEELRIEDYLANRKGGNAGTTGGFGQPATSTSGGLFGAGQANATFGGTSGAFGQSTSTGFGAQQQTGSGLFGQNTAAKPGGLFGGATTGGSLFGQTATSAAGGSLFGQTATSSSGGLFGAKPAGSFGGGFGQASTASPFGAQQQQQTGGGLFGQTTPAKTGSLFGTSTPTGSGLFGQTATSAAGGSMFGQPATTNSGGLFGAKPTASFGTGFGQTSTASPFGGQQQQTGGGLFGQSPAAKPAGLFGGAASGGSLFGQTATTSAGGSLFGQTATTNSGGLFGAKPAASFGTGFGQTSTASPFGAQTQPAGGLFGQNNAAKPGLFGATTQPAGGGLFGSTAPAGGSLFGAAKPGGLFGTTTTAAPSFGASTTTVTQAVPAAQPIVLGSDVNQYNVQKAFLDAVVSNMPYGDSPLLKGALSGAGIEKESIEKESTEKLTVHQRQARFLASKKVEMPSTIYGSPRAGLKKLPPIGADLNTSRSLNTSVRSANNTLKSVYTPPPPPVTKKVNSPLPGLNKSLSRSIHNGSLRHHLDSENGSARRRNMKTLDPAIFSSKKNSAKSGTGEHDHSTSENGEAATAEVTSHSQTAISPEHDPVAAARRRKEILRNGTVPVMNNLNATVENTSAISTRSATESGVISPNIARSPGQQKPHPAGIVLTLNEYYTEPSLEEMAVLTTPDGICRLEEGLTIGRLGYGSIFWPGPLSLSDVVIDEVVSIRSREVIVYPNDAQKPPVGSQLNRPAEISLERVWPTDKSTNEVVKDAQMLLEMGFHDRLERNCKKMGASFKDYRADTGTWVFSVPHFSKYGFDDDEDECSIYLDITKIQAHSATSNKTVYLNLDESQLEAKRARFDSDCKPFEEDDNASEQHEESNAMSSEEEIVLDIRLPKYSFKGLVNVNDSLLAGKELRKSTYIQSLLRPRAGKIVWQHDFQFIDNSVPQFNEVTIYRLNVACDINTEFFGPRFRDLTEFSSHERVGKYGAVKDTVALVDEYISVAKNCAENSAMELCKVLFTLADGKEQKAAFGEWLRSEIADDLEGVEPKDFYDYLCRGDLDGAKCQALLSGKPYMAMQLAAFANKTEAIQLHAKEQLKKWNLCGAAEDIPDSVLKSTMLLADKMVWNQMVVNDGRSWKQTLGLILWYIDGPTTTLQFAMDRLRKAAADGLVDIPASCIKFELLQLATMPGYDVRRVLKPLNAGKEPLDYHLIWHLWKVISSAAANGFPVEIPDGLSNQLHCGYSQQLSAEGRTDLALFVYMHVTSEARFQSVEDLVWRRRAAV